MGTVLILLHLTVTIRNLKVVQIVVIYINVTMLGNILSGIVRNMKQTKEQRMTDAEKAIEQLKRYQRLDRMTHLTLEEYLEIVYTSSEDAVRDMVQKNEFIEGLRKENHELKEKLQTAFDLLNHKSEVEK